MEKVVVLRENKVEEVDWDGSVQYLLEIMNCTDQDEISINIDDDTCRVGVPIYLGKYGFDDYIYDQDIMLLGKKQITFGEPIISLEEVSKKIVDEENELLKLRKKIALAE